jgi:hypothetical protein
MQLVEVSPELLELDTEQLTDPAVGFQRGD